MQIYTPTMVQERGGGRNPPSHLEFFICCSILKRFYLQWKAFDLFNKMRYILWVALLEGLSTTQKATARGIGRPRPLCTSRVWSL